MKLLIIIGAGASHDCIPNHTEPSEEFRLPLANQLFSFLLPTQRTGLRRYGLTNIASTLREKADKQGEKFNIEEELRVIKDKADLNIEKSLFKARFYIQDLIRELTNKNIESTSSYTVYTDLLRKVKDWTEASPMSRTVDIVTFNYDNLIENAMAHVYSYEWEIEKTREELKLKEYYSLHNVKIYKPHGSINWARKIIKTNNYFLYKRPEETFEVFNSIHLTDQFRFVDSSCIDNPDVEKDYIPAIAIPFRRKNDFDECPPEMQEKMRDAINQADKVITFGWKGAEGKFLQLLEANSKINKVYVISRNGNTNLKEIFLPDKLDLINTSFSSFISDNHAFEGLLDRIGKEAT